MIAGTKTVRHRHAAYQYAPMPVYLGDVQQGAPPDHSLEITKLQLAAADRGQAVDYLISQQASDRQQHIQEMALAASQAAANQAQQGQFAILEAGTVNQAALTKNLTKVATWGIVALALLKALGLFKKPREDAA